MNNLLEHSFDNPSVINDPFNSDSLNAITIRFNSDLGAEKCWWARVEFKNGNTSGEQKTPSCASFNEVMSHLKAIIDSLKKDN